MRDIFFCYRANGAEIHLETHPWGIISTPVVRNFIPWNIKSGPMGIRSLEWGHIHITELGVHPYKSKLYVQVLVLRGVFSPPAPPGVYIQTITNEGPPEFQWILHFSMVPMWAIPRTGVREKMVFISWYKSIVSKYWCDLLTDENEREKKNKIKNERE